VISRLHEQVGASALLAAIGLAAAGCSATSNDPPPRQPIAGIVLMDGRPLENGTILFFPAGHSILESPVVTGDTIKNGRFALPRDKGLAKGKYRIVISCERRVAKPIRDSAGGELEELIPRKFNRDTELAVEVKEGGIKELRVAIASK
jgi:hypothetical protein